MANPFNVVERTLVTGLGIIEMQDGTERFSPKGVNRILKIGFILGFFLANYLSYLMLGSAGNQFFFPTGFNANRLVFLTFLIQLVYHQTSYEELAELDQRLNLNWFYVESRDQSKDYEVDIDG